MVSVGSTSEGTDWKGWCGKVNVAIAAATDGASIDAILAANEAPLKNLNVAHPTWHQAILDRATAAIDKHQKGAEK